MEPDLDPPLLPLQGARILSSTSTKPSTRQPPRPPQQNSPQRKDVARSPVFLRTASRDATKARRPMVTARKGNDRSAAPTTAWKPSTPNLPTPKTKTLLPVMERKSQEDKATVRRQRNNSDAERCDITPDGGSSGREGRQFTVGNVGNNGRIYLRYVRRYAEHLVGNRYPHRRRTGSTCEDITSPKLLTMAPEPDLPFVQLTSDTHSPILFSQ